MVALEADFSLSRSALFCRPILRLGGPQDTPPFGPARGCLARPSGSDSPGEHNTSHRELTRSSAPFAETVTRILGSRDLSLAGVRGRAVRGSGRASALSVPLGSKTLIPRAESIFPILVDPSKIGRIAATSGAGDVRCPVAWRYNRRSSTGAPRGTATDDEFYTQ